MIVDNLCAITMLVRPFASSLKALWIKASLSVSRELVASSKTSIGGFFKNTRAMLNLCFWPPLSLVPLSPTCVSRPSGREETKSLKLAFLSANHISSSVQSGRP